MERRCQAIPRDYIWVLERNGMGRDGKIIEFGLWAWHILEWLIFLGIFLYGCMCTGFGDVVERRGAMRRVEDEMR